MTETEKKISELEVMLKETDSRARSNTKRLNIVAEEMRENMRLTSAIEKLAVETKYMRADLNETIERLNKWEGANNGKWEKFKWSVLSVILGIVIAFIAKAIGLN